MFLVIQGVVFYYYCCFGCSTPLLFELSLPCFEVLGKKRLLSISKSHKSSI